MTSRTAEVRSSIGVTRMENSPVEVQLFCASVVDVSVIRVTRQAQVREGDGTLCVSQCRMAGGTKPVEF